MPFKISISYSLPYDKCFTDRWKRYSRLFLSIKKKHLNINKNNKIYVNFNNIYNNEYCFIVNIIL